MAPIQINGTSGISGVDGSAGTPAIQGTDTNTGISFPTADTVVISTNGTGRLFVDSSGRVGVGTNVINSLFEARGTSDGQNIVHLSNNAGSTDGGATNVIRFTCNGNTNWGNARYDAFAHIWNTNGSERLRLDSSGRLGIGSSSPQNPLVVSNGGANGFEISSATNSGTTSYLLSYNRSTSAYTDMRFDASAFRFEVSATERMRLTSTGLGIGTTSPTHKLVVSNGGAEGIEMNWSSSDSTNFIASYNRSTSAYVPLTNYSSQFIYSNGSTERFRCDSSGRLLVGTTSAGGMLTVTSNSATVSPIATTSVSGDLAYQAILVTKFDNNTTTSQNFIQFQVNNGAANCGRITANGANTAAFGSTSDIRLKENIEDLPPQLQNILNLRPVEFDYIESEGGGHQIGFIAQEMQAVYPDVVNERGEDDMLMITGWSKTEARLVKAIQEQQAMIAELQAEVAALKAQ